MSERYNFRENETKWQAAWDKAAAFRASQNPP